MTQDVNPKAQNLTDEDNVLKEMTDFQRELFKAAVTWSTVIAIANQVGFDKIDWRKAEARFRELVLRAVDLKHPNENLCCICQTNLKECPP